MSEDSKGTPTLLTGPNIGRYLAERSARAKKIDAAVAYWGAGATKALGIEGDHERVRVICDLESGATNPYEVEKLREQQVDVRQKDRLHSKVYLFDGELAVIGSANASANGLGLEGDEVEGQIEACLATDHPSTVEATGVWFEKLWATSVEITEKDLKEAKELWARRRMVRPARSGNFDLVELVRRNDPTLANRNIYVLIWGGEPSSDFGEALEQERNELSEPKLDGFQNWELPRDATFLTFYIGPRKGIVFEGPWWTKAQAERRYTGGKKNYAELVRKGWHSAAHGYEISAAQAKTWEPAVRKWRDSLDGKWEEEYGDYMPLEKFARDYHEEISPSK